MLLMPDPNTANIDPFFEEPTLILTCDVLEPGDGKPYERDPRSLAKRAEAYLKASRPRRRRLLRPRARVLHLRQRALGRRHVGLLRARSSPKKLPGTPAWNTSAATPATARRVKGGYFPVPPVDSFQDMRSEMCLIARVSWAFRSRCITTKSANAGQMELGTKFSARWCSAPTGCSCRST